MAQTLLGSVGLHNHQSRALKTRTDVAPGSLTSPFLPCKPGKGEAVQELTIPTADGRLVKIRSCLGGEAIQIGIIGKRGGLVEAVSFDAHQLPHLLGALESVADEAIEQYNRELTQGMAAMEASLLDRLAEAEAAANATHCPEGHELTPENTFRKGANGKGCRTCRANENVWHKKAAGRS